MRLGAVVAHPRRCASPRAVPRPRRSRWPLPRIRRLRLMPPSPFLTALSSPGGCFDRPDYSCRGRTIAVEVAASAQVCASLAAIDSSPSCFLFSIRLHLLSFGSHVLCTASVVFHSQSSLSHGTCWLHAPRMRQGQSSADGAPAEVPNALPKMQAVRESKSGDGWPACSR